MSTPDLANPFTTPREEPRYGIAASGPPVDAAEVESTQRAAEVVLMWGDQVLHVAHVSPPRDVVLGERGEYAIGRDVLGADRLPVVLARGGGLACVIPAGAHGAVTVDGQTRTFDALEAEGKLAPFDGLAGARLYPLPDEASARVEHGVLTFLVKPTAAGRAIGAGGVRVKHTGWIGLSLAVHALFLVLFYFMPPHSQALSLERVRTDNRLIEFRMDAAEQEEAPPPEWANAAPGGEEGARHDGAEGQAGDHEARPTRDRMGIEGDPDDPNPEMAREAIREDMASLTAIGTLRALVGSWNTPTSPYGAEQAHGRDAMSALGALMGDQIGTNLGLHGLGMHGTGRGAGGLGEGTIGLGMLGTFCGGQRCDGDGGRGGYGDGVQLDADRDPPGGPVIRVADASVIGGLSQEAIRRVVHRHLAEVRFCYEQGLQSNPSLEGRVAVRWIISGSGRVESAALGSSSLRSGDVEGCIVQAVRRWAFPQPEGGGVVGVNYPFVLRASH